MQPETLALSLPDWDGPIDLLLHVIRTHKLDVLDIPIAFVTEQYLDYLDAMRSLNLDIAGEYLEMAATLAHIKSKMMLPPEEVQEEEAPEPEGDPREELVRRLLEYQRYKEAAQQLSGQPLLGRDTFVVGAEPPPPPEGDAGPLTELGLFDLAEAFRRILARTKSSLAHEVSIERITVSERIGEISELVASGELLPFEELFGENPSKIQVVVTFLALLEMTKLKMTRIYQSSGEGQIYVILAGSQPLDEADIMGYESAARSRGRAESWQRMTRWARATSRRPLPRTIQRLRSLRRGMGQPRASKQRPPRQHRRRATSRRRPKLGRPTPNTVRARR